MVDAASLVPDAHRLGDQDRGDPLWRAHVHETSASIALGLMLGDITGGCFWALLGMVNNKTYYDLGVRSAHSASNRTVRTPHAGILSGSSTRSLP